MIYNLFPYHLVEAGSKIILYGAGQIMRAYVEQLQITSYCKILCAVDRNYAAIDNYHGVKVVSPNDIMSMAYDSIVVAVSELYRKSVYDDLATMGIPSNRIVYADYNAIEANTAKRIKKCHKNVDSSLQTNSDRQAYVTKPTVICIFNGEGITDNIKGAIGVYTICKSLGLRFKINILNPFKLSDFLLPATYDWQITSEEFTVAEHENNFCEFSGVYYNHNLPEVSNQIEAKSKNHNYLIVKTNINLLTGSEYGKLYDELFQPVSELREAVEFHLRQIGVGFISASFRFMQLLGDFAEAKCRPYPILEPSEQQTLIGQCLGHLDEIHRENQAKKIFVVSDSISFLAAAQKLPYVYVVPGEIAHSGSSQAASLDNSVWRKYFLDYFLLKHSTKNYLVIDGAMYKSSIPIYAAWHGNATIDIKDYNKVILDTAILQLYQFLYGNVVDSTDDKELLTLKALTAFRTVGWLRFKNTGLDIYEKLYDDESKTIYKELFYHNFVAARNKDSRHYCCRVHCSNILQTTLQCRLAEKGKNLSDILAYDKNFFLGMQYFDVAAPRGEDEVFVDAGARDGAVINDFLKYCNGRYRHIYAFEPEPDNYRRLCANLKDWGVENATLVPKGLSSDNATVDLGVFSQNFISGGSSIGVPMISLDLFLDESECITFIKMDIGGFELEALLGARETIRRWKPRLAISIYHKPCDIIDLPAYILQIVPEYKFCIRHYSFSTQDTVLYAMVDDK